MDETRHVDLTRCFGFASTFAFTLHNGQRREGNGVPYCAQLTAVAATVLEGSAAMLKFNAPVVDLLAYYDGCLAAVRDGVPAGLATELDRTLAELRALLVLPGRPGFAAARP